MRATSVRRRRDYDRIDDQNGNNRRSKTVEKKSTGCKLGQSKTGRPYISAWNFQQRRGLLTALIFPYSGTTEHTSKNGREWSNWMAKVTWKDSGVEKMIPCLYDHQTKRVIIKELGMIANPSKDYFGSYKRD